MKYLLLILSLSLISCSSRVRTAIDYDFSSKEVEGKSLKLWATNYYTPVYSARMNGFPLKDLGENTMAHGVHPVLLSRKEWCYSAMEGSVSIKFPEGLQRTYNYAGTTTEQVDCSRYFGKDFPKTNKVRFKSARSRWGDGISIYSLVPFRSIAVDPKIIPFGSVIFIPAAKGAQFHWVGKSIVHDGYFFAADKGGAIRGNHIDVFTGNSRSHSFSFIKNKKSGSFQAIIIDDSEIIEDLNRIHTKAY
ncbi:hypothetical protein A9Q84_03675 [Halobacteriovorax marinus]|uniref:3D domain-containing protein n=1 Tax=Halobacteriovorax marinus TaxID=97084 RepID=A0A1Y5FFP4_9BACT|nr:hypothetical protein A9Q84_03675 [Halobacteriovorax marinus]